MTSPSITLHSGLSPVDLAAFVRHRSRMVAGRLTARVLALSVMIVLAIGTTLSIVTTTAQKWWLQHFSELGTFDDFSGHVFNSTLIVAGLLVTTFAVRVRVDLLSLTVMRGVRPSRILTICMVLVGLNMSGVGLVPLNTISFLHDRLASGIMLSFLGLLVVIVVRHRHGTALLLGATIGIAVGLGVAITLFLFGILNLAALEIIGFTLIFVWVGVFTACLEKGMTRARQLETADAALAPEDTPRSGAVSSSALVVTSTAPLTWPRSCTATGLVQRLGPVPSTNPLQSTAGFTTAVPAPATGTWDAGIRTLPSCSEECRARGERTPDAIAEELVPL